MSQFEITHCEHEVFSTAFFLQGREQCVSHALGSPHTKGIFVVAINGLKSSDLSQECINAIQHGTQRIQPDICYISDGFLSIEKGEGRL